MVDEMNKGVDRTDMPIVKFLVPKDMSFSIKTVYGTYVLRR